MCFLVSNYNFDLNNLHYINNKNNNEKTSSYLFIFIINKKNKKAIISTYIISVSYAFYQSLFFFSV